MAQAARTLMAAARPVIYAGWGVVSADGCAELKELAELLGAPVATSVKGKGALPDDHPLCLGCAWAAEVRESPALTRADVMLAIGTRFTLRTAGWGRVPIPPTLIQVDRDPGAFGRTVPVQQTISGDARRVLRRLVALLREVGYERRHEPEVWGDYRAAIRARIEATVPARSPLGGQMRAALRRGLARDAIVTGFAQAATTTTTTLASGDIIKAAALLGGGLALAGMAVGAGIGDALVSGRTIEGVARQPEARGTLLGLTFLFIGLVDSFPVIGLVLALFIIFTKS